MYSFKHYFWLQVCVWHSLELKRSQVSRRGFVKWTMMDVGREKNANWKDMSILMLDLIQYGMEMGMTNMWKPYGFPIHGCMDC